MLRPVTYITFTKSDLTEITFNFCHSWETDESYEHLTDTAKIIIPRKLNIQDVDLFAGANPVFERGDKVKIEAGYFPNKRLIFDGFIDKISAKIPVEIYCEDHMWILKQYTVNYPQKERITTITRGKATKKNPYGKLLKRPKIISPNISLGELLDNIIDDSVNYKIVDDIKLGQFRVTNATPAMVLEKLNDEYGLFSYFKDGVLNVGFANNATVTNEALFEMERVVINADELDFQQKTDLNLKVKAISMMPDNTKIEVEVGDPDGEQRTIHKYNMNESDLRKVAEKWLAENKYTGFKGELVTFGEPFLRHGDRAKIISTKLPERNGTYLIKGVKRVFSVDEGYRQTFDLGIKVA